MKALIPWLALAAAGCGSAPPPEPAAVPRPATVDLRDDPDAQVEEIATVIEDDAAFGDLPPLDPSRAACYMDGTTVARDGAPTGSWDGRTFTFCTPRCRDAFLASPQRWVGSALHRAEIAGTR